MAPGRRQGRGCWTCRLRRKRCDSVRPVCGTCQNLEITCYSGEARPLWMDGGAGQKHMSETIKGIIKQNAFLQKERRLFTHKDQGIIIISESDQYSLSADSLASTLSTSGLKHTTLGSSIDRSEDSQSPSTAAFSTSGPVTLPTVFSSPSSWPAGLAVPIQPQLGSVMIYLDYVFPFLFPFYQPSLIETGRQWVLGLLCQNEVTFHIAATLSAYFFSLVSQNNEQDMHDECKALVRDRLFEQMDMAVTSMQSTLSATNHYGAQSPLLERARIMEEITQLLIVEVTVQRNVDWTIHLTPALALFDEIFKSHGTNHWRPSLAVLLSSFPMATAHHKPLPNTADQSALEFFVSLLLFIDIVASTSLRNPPALQKYHDSLLSSHGEEKSGTRLEAVIGCQNWALVAVGNISALCAWKRDAKQRGSFSVVHLVNLARPISQALEEGLTSLDIGSIRSQPRKMSPSWLQGYYSRHDRAINYTSIANVTRIWAYAARIYLSVSLSGWQTNCIDTQVSVTKILSLLQTIESPAQLRNLSWPISIAGCLASPSQEDDFRRIVGLIGPLGKFGTALNALHIMEAVWSSRDTIDGNVWEIASCLNILGSSALLL